MTISYADRALALVGSRFRAQGRAPDSGLDCAGVTIAAYGLAAERFRRDYRLRGDHRMEMIAALARDFRRVARKAKRAGDLLLLEVARDQWHLAVMTPRGFVHADARLGRVVECPGAPSWRVAAVFRRRVRKMRSV